MDEDDEIDLAYFAGEHEFSGIQVDEETDEYGDILKKVTIVLNDTFFTFTEKSSVGLEESRVEVCIDDWTDILDVSRPQNLMGELIKDNCSFFIDLTNPYTDEVVIRIGTMDMDTLYPYFVFEYFPEHLSSRDDDYDDDD